MPAFLPDTSCMVAATCAWHEHHVPARDEIDRRLRRSEPMLVAAPALVESYAVLTRLPAPYRLAPADALALLEANFIEAGRVVALHGEDYVALLRRAPEEGISGGRTYDAVIAACVPMNKGTTILTLNPSHFASSTGRGVEVVVPGETR